MVHSQEIERLLPDTSIYLAEMDRSGLKFDLLGLFDADVLGLAS